MQMARVFENHTLSSALRYAGAILDRQNRMLEDTLQAELDQQVQAQIGSRPVALGDVIETNAGHPNSPLRSRGIRYILHAATVSVTHGIHMKTMTPIEQPKDIRQAVLNCFYKVHEINTKRGVISPAGTPGYAQELQNAARFEPIRSMIFPLFGTGHASANAIAVVEPMLKGVVEFLETHQETSLRDIYLCVYRQRDLPVVESAMSKVFAPVVR
jgi:O-acetyl-ADP-ribose deacetylase (regulator of RNase III)